METVFPFADVARSRPVALAGATLYAARQTVVAALLSPAAALLHVLTGTREPPRSRKLQAILERRHREGLLKDFEHAAADLYPMRLLAPLPGWHDVRFLPEALLDVPRMVRRKRHLDFDLAPEAVAGTEVPLPEYYRRAFHWQSDGWLSAHSARVYELQVEVLFSGAMDVMRRRGLAALVRALAGDRRRMRVRILDVACGTGRFLEQVRAALPEATLEGVDLSPFYVERARRRLAGDGLVTFKVANGEALPSGDGVYDAVTCGFLFHELPKDARRRVTSELYRALRPGGVLVVEDSMQRSDPDADELAPILDWFPRAYHEPYYKGYVADDLGTMLEAAGFVVEARDYVMVSKVVVARKPLDD